MEILKNFIHSLTYLQIAGLVLYIISNIWLMTLCLNVYKGINLEGFKASFFLLPISILGFSFNMSNGKLNVFSAATMLGITISIILLSIGGVVVFIIIPMRTKAEE